MMIVMKKENFPVELYKVLLTSAEDVSRQDEDARTVLHYM